MPRLTCEQRVANLVALAQELLDIAKGFGSEKPFIVPIMFAGAALALSSAIFHYLGGRARSRPDRNLELLAKPVSQALTTDAADEEAIAALVCGLETRPYEGDISLVLRFCLKATQWLARHGVATEKLKATLREIQAARK